MIEMKIIKETRKSTITGEIFKDIQTGKPILFKSVVIGMELMIFLALIFFILILSVITSIDEERAVGSAIDTGIGTITKDNVAIVCTPLNKSLYSYYIANNKIEELNLNFNISMNFDEEFLEKWEKEKGAVWKKN